MSLLFGLAALAACQAAAPDAAAAVVPEHAASERADTCGGVEVAWRRAATQNDRVRLRNWRTSWLDAVAKAKAGGGAEVIARDIVRGVERGASMIRSGPYAALLCGMMRVSRRLTRRLSIASSQQIGFLGPRRAAG